jgi:hypothetical protein
VKISDPSVPDLASAVSSLPRPVNTWASDASALNPSTDSLPKQRRDTSEGCRDRATDSLYHAMTMVTASDRSSLRNNAARWTARAELLQGEEDSFEADQVGPATSQAQPSSIVLF